MFMEKGYDSVTMADVAAASEVSLSTVFNYFPKKETLVFDIEEELGVKLAEAVRDRAKDESILDALKRYFLESPHFNPPSKKIFLDFMKLVRSTPELSSYFRMTLARYEGLLAKEIQKESEVSKLEAECISKLVLEGLSPSVMIKRLAS
ncbi:MAG: TetR family transcriptional regulator, partial [Proteobacteria bacterium]